MPARIFDLFVSQGRTSVRDLNLSDGGAVTWVNCLFDQLERCADMGVWQLDLPSGNLHWSQQVYALCGVSPDKAVSIDDFLALCSGADRSLAQEAFATAIASEGSFSFHADVTRPDGDHRRVHCFGDRIAFDGTRECLLGILRDETEAHRAYLELIDKAGRDELTGLPNRRDFEQHLARAITSADPWHPKVRLLMLGLDGLADINATHGYLTGDLTIRVVGERLRAAMPEGVVVARWTGDEFGILLPASLSSELIGRFVERLMEIVAMPIDQAGQRIEVGATGGLAEYATGMGVKEFVRRAEMALSQAKVRERRGLLHFDEAFDLPQIRRRDAIATVRKAIDKGRLFAAYQPIVDLETGHIRGAEALLRLFDPTGAILSAGQFVSGLSDPWISREVFERMVLLAGCEMGELRASVPSLQFISLNATQPDLLRRNFAKDFLSKLDDVGISTGSIVLEVTETILMVDDFESIRAVLRQLHEHGIGIALDDFGTGYSSLAHLRDFPIDKVKIDGSFTRKLLSDRTSRAIVTATIAMARALDIEVIAEGIEDSRTGDLLLEMGCQSGQGYLYSPAVESDRFKRWPEQRIRLAA